jgi:hypothetical protein
MMTVEQIEALPTAEQEAAWIARTQAMEAQAAEFWAAQRTDPIAKARKRRKAVDSDWCPKCRRTGCGGC